jgi:hypothetical protein
VFEARGAITLDAAAEVALELARRLVVEVAALGRPPRGRRR